ncbi:hypothetical protein ACN6K4_000098 [Streptomyces hayashii]|uniref:hypothetical protein n=1 Tax=Streptomyces hayashii TaxID=2839966 RepID=UPI00403CEA33
MTSVRPATQPSAGAGDETAGADGFGPPGLAASVAVGEPGAGGTGEAELFVGALRGGSVERFPDAPPSEPPPCDVLHAARTTTTGTIRPAAHHRISHPPVR